MVAAPRWRRDLFQPQKETFSWKNDSIAPATTGCFPACALARVLAVILGFVSFGTFLLLYLVLALIIPLEPEQALTPREEQTVIDRK